MNIYIYVFKQCFFAFYRFFLLMLLIFKLDLNNKTSQNKHKIYLYLDKNERKKIK